MYKYCEFGRQCIGNNIRRLFLHIVALSLQKEAYSRDYVLHLSNDCLSNDNVIMSTVPYITPPPLHTPLFEHFGTLCMHNMMTKIRRARESITIKTDATLRRDG